MSDWDHVGPPPWTDAEIRDSEKLWGEIDQHDKEVAEYLAKVEAVAEAVLGGMEPPERLEDRKSLKFLQEEDGRHE